MKIKTDDFITNAAKLFEGRPDSSGTPFTAESARAMATNMAADLDENHDGTISAMEQGAAVRLIDPSLFGYKSIIQTSGAAKDVKDFLRHSGITPSTSAVVGANALELAKTVALSPVLAVIWLLDRMNGL